MSQGLLCDGINLLLDVYQSIVDVFFFWLSFVGVSAPDITAGIGSYLGCNL
ncbi:MAG TPA: hypothetical protein VJZ71_06215 [Phycisphaerae bacterium]|nr:hypothetical protein [Phycisphaerae bacterium]